MELQEYLDRLPDNRRQHAIQLVQEKGEDHLRCPKCNVRFRCVRKDGTTGGSCMSGTCHPNYGKKRPAHSKTMAAKAANGELSSTFKKGQRNDFVNSLEWKRTVLTNKDIPHQHISDDDLVSLYNSYKGQLATNWKTKIKRCNTLLDRYRDESERLFEYTPDRFSEDDSSDYITMWLSRLNGIKTIKCNLGTSGSKRFKRSKLLNLQHTISGVDNVTTKSSYETRYALLFEEEGVKWEYEPFIVQIDNVLYVPDFIFEYGDQKYMLEVKGFFETEEQRVEYMRTKIQTAITWCEKNDVVFLFTYDGHPKTIKQIIEEAA